MTSTVTITEIDYHRNGVGGNGFYVVKFRDGKSKMLGIVFDEPGSVAVFDQNLLAQEIIAFGINSWRGDYYEADLRKATEEWLDRLSANNTHKPTGE